MIRHLCLCFQCSGRPCIYHITVVFFPTMVRGATKTPTSRLEYIYLPFIVRVVCILAMKIQFDVVLNFSTTRFV